MRKSFCIAAAFLAAFACFASAPSFADDTEEGFVSLFDGKTLNGWSVHSGAAKYKVEDGAIVGECVPGTPNNTFLCYEKPFGNFILKLDFKAVVPGNSGVQFRSAIEEGSDRVYGYQCEIAPDDKVTARIYDEGRRGFAHGRIFLDNTADETLEAGLAAYKSGDWNSLEIQAIGPSLRTWINGVPVTNIYDYKDFRFTPEARERSRGKTSASRILAFPNGKTSSSRRTANGKSMEPISSFPSVGASTKRASSSVSMTIPKSATASSSPTTNTTILSLKSITSSAAA